MRTLAIIVCLLALRPSARAATPAHGDHRHVPDDVHQQVADEALQHLQVEVQVAGQSQSQLDASRYDVKVVDGDVSAPDVTIPGVGAVRGTVAQTEQRRRPIYQYLGIPFAEPPVKERRFVAPVPKAAWAGVLDATKYGKACIQTDTSGTANRRRRANRDDVRELRADEQSEDCLVLDVHTPRSPANKTDAKLLPVLVFVHGGSFLTGSSSIKTPYGLLDEGDVILVSPQYRLGVLGFLNLQRDEVPGNAGLLDVVEALRWVNKNIEAFGGDPGRVVLGGHSAGAATASLLYLSPLTQGLIHGVMPMSGGALSDWAFDRQPEEAAALITTTAGCQLGTVKCLQEKPAEDLIDAFKLYALGSLLQGHLGMSGSTPSVQKAGAVRLFPDTPENILTSKNFSVQALPYLTGVTKHEGTFPLQLAETGYLVPNGLTEDSSFLKYDLIHVLLKVIGVDDQAGFVADAVAEAFLDPGSQGNLKAMTDGLIDMAGAFGFKSPARQIVQLNSQLGKPSYLYAFNHYGADTRYSPTGIAHGADQPYLFPAQSDSGSSFTGDDLKVALALRRLVANFVTYLNPTPPESPLAVSGADVKAVSWSPYARGAEHYLELVWPPVEGEGFGPQLIAARTERFSERGDEQPEQPASTLTSTPAFGSACAHAASVTLLIAASLWLAVLRVQRN